MRIAPRLRVAGVVAWRCVTVGGCQPNAPPPPSPNGRAALRSGTVATAAPSLRTRNSGLGLFSRGISSPRLVRVSSLWSEGLHQIAAPPTRSLPAAFLPSPPGHQTDTLRPRLSVLARCFVLFRVPQEFMLLEFLQPAPRRCRTPTRGHPQ